MDDISRRMIEAGERELEALYGVVTHDHLVAKIYSVMKSIEQDEVKKMMDDIFTA